MPARRKATEFDFESNDEDLPTFEKLVKSVREPDILMAEAAKHESSCRCTTCRLIRKNARIERVGSRDERALACEDFATRTHEQDAVLMAAYLDHGDVLPLADLEASGCLCRRCTESRTRRNVPPPLPAYARFWEVRNKRIGQDISIAGIAADYEAIRVRRLEEKRLAKAAAKRMREVERAAHVKRKWIRQQEFEWSWSDSD